MTLRDQAIFEERRHDAGLEIRRATGQLEAIGRAIVLAREKAFPVVGGMDPISRALNEALYDFAAKGVI